MKVSVALCTYNGARFLRQQLDSIASQTLLPHELVVCDDASRDETLAIVCEFAQNAPFRVRIFNSDENLGVMKNFARCIDLCEGDAIAPCDQDDIWLPQKLECFAEILKSPKVGLVFSDAQMMDEQGHKLSSHLWGAIDFHAAKQREFKQDAFGFLLRGNVVTGTAMMFRANLKTQILPMPEAIPVLHDAWIALVAAAKSDVQLVEEPLLKYRQHAAQHTRERDSAIKRIKSVAHYRQHLHLLEELQTRIEDPQKLGLVEDNAAHLQTRLDLPTAPILRAGRVLNELIRGRYNRYSGGWRSAARDLVYGTAR